VPVPRGLRRETLQDQRQGTRGKIACSERTFLRDQPLNPEHPDMSTVGGPCVHPVESVEAAE